MANIKVINNPYTLSIANPVIDGQAILNYWFWHPLRSRERKLLIKKIAFYYYCGFCTYEGEGIYFEDPSLTAKWLNCGKRSVRGAFKKLKDLGFIESNRKQSDYRKKKWNLTISGLIYTEFWRFSKEYFIKGEPKVILKRYELCNYIIEKRIEFGRLTLCAINCI